MNFIEECWEQREEIIYKFLFNGLGEGIYPINSEVFQNQFQREEIDPMWLHYGVFKCPPSQSHSSWVYVTSGMSNPWETDVCRFRRANPIKISGLITRLAIDYRKAGRAFALPALIM
nr:hypothetical protein [uncultured Desulfobacter sp.]